LLGSLSRASSEFSKRAVFFSLGTVLGFLLMIISLLAMVGLFLLVYYGMAILDVAGENVMILAAALTLAFLIYLYVSHGLKGALIKTYQSIRQGERPHASYYLNYALGNGEVFLLITIVKLICMAIFLAPLAVIYFYVLNGSGNIIVNVAFALAGLFLVFIMEFPFSFAYISAAVDERGVIYAIKQGFKFVIKKNISALGLFFVYAISWVFLLIPLLQIASFLALYPLTYTSLIIAYEDFSSGTARAPSAPRDPPQAKFTKKRQKQIRETKKEEVEDDYYPS